MAQARRSLGRSGWPDLVRCWRGGRGGRLSTAAAAGLAGRQARIRCLKFDLDVPGVVSVQAGSCTDPRAAKRWWPRWSMRSTWGACPETKLVFDLHWRYGLPSASRLAAVLAGQPVMWLEDPLPPENISGPARGVGGVEVRPVGRPVLDLPCLQGSHDSRGRRCRWTRSPRSVGIGAHT